MSQNQKVSEILLSSTKRLMAGLIKMYLQVPMDKVFGMKIFHH